VNSSESWFCTATISTIERATSICSMFAFESPTQRTLPSSWSSLNAPIVSAYGTSGSGRWYW
jgi:hypothetical protein